jgi:hypothetical protein
MLPTARNAFLGLAVLTALAASALVVQADYLPVMALSSCGQTGLQPILYDDCGARGRQPQVVNGGSWTFAEQDVTGPLSVRTVAFEAKALGMRYEGLAPEARYGLRITYVTERTNPRTQRLTAEGQQVHGDVSLPQGEARQFEFRLPDGIAADRAIDLSFELVSGHNAEVSEAWLLSDRPQPRLSVDLASDLLGHLTVTALDGLLAPIDGAQAQVEWPAVAAGSSRTDARGQAVFTLPSSASREGEAHVRVQAGELTQTARIPLTSIIFSQPVLTPIPDTVTGVQQPRLDLNGQWRFSAAPPEGFWDPGFDDSAWGRLEVPGEWVMQGQSVEPGKAAGYRRRFSVPEDWRGCVAKGRFDAVYSKCEVWLNGKRVGGHEGGFTPFEVDVTQAIAPGRPNVLALAVTSESLADTLASASSYARHPLGGITRNVTAFALPRTHLARCHVTTDLDDRYRNAELTVTSEVAGGKADLRVSVSGLAGVGQGSGDPVRLPVSRPKLWDCEHPNLYTMQAELLVGGRVVERVSRRIGFREVEVRGNQLLVNGRPVKLHGVCRHEVHPERGRSLTPTVWRRDVELLKGCNVNFVRTSHYSPAEEFVALCDEAGIYVQEEGPYCWVGNGNEGSADTLGLMVRQQAEMMERDLSHPSVIIWDVANESAWGTNFVRMTQYAHAQDPTRPTLFSGAGVGEVDDPTQRPDIDDWHYPGPSGPERCATAERPVTFGEYCHLNCYNVAEVEADPGVRDYWGRALQPMWDAMYASRGCLGGTIWCWADDVFELPGNGRVGYGEWGVIDGNQRPKPEWWHVRKTYSPTRIPVKWAEPGETVALPIENRYNHTNLSEIECRWELGRRRGTVSLDLPPHSAGTLTVPVAAKAGDLLRLEFRDPSGRVVDEYALPVSPPDTAAILPRPSPEQVLAGVTSGIYADSGWPEIVLTEQGTGRDIAGQSEAATQGAKVTGGQLRMEVRRKYSIGEATWTVETSPQGTRWRYRLVYEGPEVTVREIGLLRRLSRDFARLSWERADQWTVYPDDHIGRPIGSAWAFPKPTEETPGPWSLLPDGRGCNDFRSTKYGILCASLTNAQGLGLGVASDGTQSVRATVEPDGVVFRVLDFSNGGGEGFLRGHYAKDYRTLKPGDVLEGGAVFRLVSAPVR